MNFRLQLTAWFGIALAALVALLVVSAHNHLDEELRREKWDRSHPDYPDWILHGSYSDAEIHDILGELLHVWLWVGTPALVVALSIGYALANRSLRPIRAIHAELAAVEPETLKTGIRVPENDAALADLVAQINGLLERVGRAYDEMAAFSSNVAHELRTPLSLLRMRVEQSARDLPPDFSEELQEELARLARFVERSLLAAKAQSGRLELAPVTLDLSEILDDLEEIYRIAAADRGLSLDWVVVRGLWIRADPDVVRQILHNLLGNAVRYAAGAIRMRASAGAAAVRVTIVNDCAREKRPSPGIGLGLRLCRGLVGVMRGAGITLRDRGGAFGVRLWFPQAEAAQCAGNGAGARREIPRP